MSVDLIAQASGHRAEINEDNELLVALNPDSTKSGFASLVSEKGVLPNGTRLMKELECSEDYRLRVEGDNLWLADYPIGTALNTSIWSGPVTTQTLTVGSNRYELNSSGITTINTGSMLKSWRTFPWFKANALYVEFALNWTAAPVANWIAEWGYFNSSTAIAAITDGAYFQLNGPVFRGVIRNNSVETFVDLGPVLDFGSVHDFVIEITQDSCLFWHEGNLLGEVATPASQYGPLGLQQCYTAVRTYNGAVAPAAAIKLQVSAIQVSNGGADFNRLWPTVMSGMGGGAYQAPTGMAVGQTAAYANGAAPTTRALSATTKMEVGLGGMTAIAAWAGVETDYNVFGYQVPVGKTLLVRGVRIECANLGAIVATTATLLQWSVGIGASADTLAGSESATVKVRRAIPLGFQTFPVGAGIGAVAAPIDVNFDAALTIHSGEWFQIIVRAPVGTATASQVLRPMAMVNGYFE